MTNGIEFHKEWLTCSGVPPTVKLLTAQAASFWILKSPVARARIIGETKSASITICRETTTTESLSTHNATLLPEPDVCFLLLYLIMSTRPPMEENMYVMTDERGGAGVHTRTIPGLECWSKVFK